MANLPYLNSLAGNIGGTMPTTASITSHIGTCCSDQTVTSGIGGGYYYYYLTDSCSHIGNQQTSNIVHQDPGFWIPDYEIYTDWTDSEFHGIGGGYMSQDQYTYTYVSSGVGNIQEPPRLTIDELHNAQQLISSQIGEITERAYQQLMQDPTVGLRQDPAPPEYVPLPKPDVQRNSKADKLLKNLIGKDQFEQYKKDGYIDVQSPKDAEKRYRIRQDRRIGIVKLENGQWIEKALSLCIHPPNSYAWPKGDLVATAILLAKYNERELEATANLHQCAA